MKKLLLNLTMLLVAMLWGGVAQGAETTEIWSLDFTKLSTSSDKNISGLTSKGEYVKVGQSGWTYKSVYVNEFEHIAFTRLWNSGKQYGFCYRYSALLCINNSHTMTLVGLGKNNIVTVTTSANAISQNYVGNNGAEASSTISEDAKTYTYRMKADGDLNLQVNAGSFIYSIKVEKSDESTANYTINYKLGDEIIKTSNGSYVVGEKIEAESPITVDGTKYYTADDAKTSFTVTSDEENNVFNVALRKANEYAYTVTNSFGEQLTSGTGIEGEAVTGNYVQYISKNGTLHEAERGKEEYYKYSFIPTDNNYNYNIVYKETNINNVVYFSEGEDIEGMTSTGNANADIRCSNGKGGYSNEAITATTLQPGKYKVTANVWGNTGATFEIKANETSILSIATTGSITSKTSEEFELTESTPITISGGDRSKMLDYIYITKTADILNLNTDYVYSTYCPETDLDFSNVEDVKAYSVKVNGKAITLNEINGKVKAGEGILIANTGKVASVTVPVTTGAESIADNDLKGVTADMTASQLVDNNAYILVDDNTFQKVGDSTTGTLKKGKAYLQVNNASAAKQMFIVNPTAVNGVKEQTENAAAVIYNAQGMQVKTPVKGLYIVNGKKYIK